MRYGIIGVSGHHHQALDAAREGLCEFPVAVARGSEGEDARPLAEKLGVPYYDSWREMISEVRPDAAVVNPWFVDNASVSAECLKAGLDVYSEKPLATEDDALDALKNVWTESGKNLGCMLNLNCCSWFRAVENAIADGEIGKVRLIHGQKSYRMGARGPLYQKRRDYGGILPWVGVHAIDWVLRLGGRCVSVSASQTAICNGGNGELEATAAALLTLENGVIATVTTDFLRPTGSARHDDDRLRVTGTRGMIEAVDGRVFLENENAKRELPLPPAVNPFIRFLNTRGTPEGRRLTEEAFEDSRICLLARRAGDEGRVLRA